MPAIMDTILMEMSKMWKVTDSHTDERLNMVDRPQHKLAWSKAPGELTIEYLHNGCCGGHHGYHNNCLSNSESPCCPNASQQVLAQSDLPFRSRWGLKIFKMATLGPSYISEKNDFSNSESLCHSDATYQVWAQSALRFRRCHLKNFKMAAMLSWLSEWNEFSSSESPCLPNAYHQVSAQSNLPFGSRWCFKIFKLATMAAILDIGTEQI